MPAGREDGPFSSPNTPWYKKSFYWNLFELLIGAGGKNPIKIYFNYELRDIFPKFVSLLKQFYENFEQVILGFFLSRSQRSHKIVLKVIRILGKIPNSVDSYN